MFADVALWLVAGLLGTAVLGVPWGRSPYSRPAVYSACLVLSSIMLALAIAQLAGLIEQGTAATLPLGLPWIGAHFRIDALAALFLGIVNLGGMGASLFGIGYGRHEPAPHRVLPFFPAFLAGMNLVVLADDAFTFLLSWEFMSLASWALVLAHHRNTENARAAYIYLVMATFGTMALLLAFGLLAGVDGGYTFDAIRAENQAPWGRALVLVLVLLGAGSKAGIVPLHVWLPLAHPAAPSHVSALMSGVMTKVAIYGIIRIIFDLLGEFTWWMSIPVLFLGGLTAVMGILYALMETDLKRVLAYSTIENIGLIVVNLGLAIAFRANGMGWAAALAMTAALLHAINHSLFKSLLFFGSGAVLTVTRQGNMENLGGLIHKMPHTGFAFLIGCVSISALPPFNGFVSEWLTFQAILQSPGLPQWGLKVMVPALGGLLALSAALAAACFVRMYGVTFLGRPRSDAARNCTEIDRFSLGAMFAFAALCLLIGILPGFVIDGLSPVVQPLVDAHMPTQSPLPWLSIIPVAESRSSYNGLLVFLFITFSASLAVYVIHRFASRALRRAPAWDCGFPNQGTATQYTAGGFAQPIRRVFGSIVFRTKEHVDMPPPGSVEPARFTVGLKDLAWNGLYAPLASAVTYASERLNILQFLTIRRYLSLVFLALVTLLLVLTLWQ